MPIDENYKLPQPERPEPLPEDSYVVVVEDVEEVDATDYLGKPTRKLQFIFRIIDGEFKGRKLYKKVSTIFSPARAGRSASNLYTIVTKAFKQQVKPEDLKLSNIIGKQLKVVVIQNEFEGVVYNNISSFMEIKENLKVEEDAELDKSIDSIPF